MIFVNYNLKSSKSGRSSTWRSARSMATDKALERGERPSGVRGELWRRGIESFRDLKRRPEELVDNTFILSVKSLNAPTSSITIFPPSGTSTADGLEAEHRRKETRLSRGRKKRESRSMWVRGSVDLEKEWGVVKSEACNCKTSIFGFCFFSFNWIECEAYYNLLLFLLRFSVRRRQQTTLVVVSWSRRYGLTCGPLWLVTCLNNNMKYLVKKIIILSHK